MDRVLETTMVGFVVLVHVAVLFAVYPAAVPAAFALVGVATLLAPVLAAVAVFRWSVTAADAGKHLLATAPLLGGSLALLQAGVVSPVPGAVAAVVYRTLLWLVPAAVGYGFAFRLGLLDRDGPVGELLGLA